MSNKLKAMQFPKYLKTNRGTYTVVGPIDGFDYFSIDLARSLEAGKGYLNYCDDTIWIFADKKPVHSTQAPYFWVDVGNNGARFVRSRPANMILEQFSKKHLLELSEESIKEETRKMPEKSPDDDEFLEMNFKSNEVFFIQLIYCHETDLSPYDRAANTGDDPNFAAAIENDTDCVPLLTIIVVVDGAA